MNPQIFGWQHLTFIAVLVTFGIASIILIKRYCKSEKALSIAIKAYSGLLLFFILFNRITICVANNSALYMIPQSFCGFTSMAFGIIGLIVKKDAKILHWIVYCGVLGGLLTMIYPDFIGQAPSMFYPATFSGLVHHTISFFLGVTMIATGFIRPSFKRWAWLPLGLCCMMTYGLFLIEGLGFPSAMYIGDPLIEGTIFTWYFTGFLFLLLYYSSLLIVYFIQKQKAKKKIEKVKELNKK